MRSYEIARKYFSFLEFLAWSVVVIGVLIAVIGGGSVSQYAGAGLFAMAPGIGISIAGILLVAFVQIGRATVDTAEYTQQMLKISRTQLEVSEQGLRLQNAVPQTFAAVAQTESGQEPKTSFADQANENLQQGGTVENLEPELSVDQNTIYRGKTIRNEKGKYIYKSIPFDTLLAAKEHVDFWATPSATKLPAASKET